VQCVDYLSGDDAYKRLWMSEVRERSGLVAYRLGRPRGLLGAARQVLSLARKRTARAAVSTANGL
jgi:hypothetical protein